MVLGGGRRENEPFYLAVPPQRVVILPLHGLHVLYKYIKDMKCYEQRKEQHRLFGVLPKARWAP